MSYDNLDTFHINSKKAFISPKYNDKSRARAWLSIALFWLFSSSLGYNMGLELMSERGISQCSMGRDRRLIIREHA